MLKLFFSSFRKGTQVSDVVTRTLISPHATLSIWGWREQRKELVCLIGQFFWSAGRPFGAPRTWSRALVKVFWFSLGSGFEF